MMAPSGGVLPIRGRMNFRGMRNLAMRELEGQAVRTDGRASRRASRWKGAAEPKCMQLISGQLGIELKCKPEDVDDAP